MGLRPGPVVTGAMVLTAALVFLTVVLAIAAVAVSRVAQPIEAAD